MAATSALITSPPPPAVWTLNVSSAIGKDNVEFVNDLSRMLVLQTFIQMMLYLSCSERFGMFTADFAILLLFVAIGVTFYWLVFRRIVAFV